MINQTSREHSGALGRCERDGFPVVLAGRALGAGSLDASGRGVHSRDAGGSGECAVQRGGHGQGISVWVNAGLDAEVFDAQGGLVPCAHQRPDGVFKSAAR